MVISNGGERVGPEQWFEDRYDVDFRVGEDGRVMKEGGKEDSRQRA
jgi:hypothetical protein